MERSQEIINNAESFGIDLAALDESVEIPWPEEVDRTPLLLRKFTADDVASSTKPETRGESESEQKLAGIWIIFSCGDHHVPYWLPE